MGAPRFLYLHGFASSPASRKAVAFAEHFAARGLAIERLDLRLPSFERLSFAAMMERTRDAIGGPDDRALLVGSSLGGLCAARVAEADARVAGLFLLAPALRHVDRWRARLGADAWAKWKATNWLTVEDLATGDRDARIHHAFIEELGVIDAKNGGMPDVRVPTCVVHGTRDAVVDVAVSRELASGRCHVRLVEVDDDHDLAGSIPRSLEEFDRFAAPWGV